MIEFTYSLTLVQILLSTTKPIVQGCAPSVTTASGWKAPKGQICKNQLIFEENFNTLNQRVWKHEQTLSGGGNWEFQWYVNDRKNSFIENGVLNIRPTFTKDYIGGEDKLYSATINIPPDQCTESYAWGCERTGAPDRILNPIRSAKIRTTDSFSFKYGKVEFRAKIPAGDWLWPALWMMPKDSVYGPWPASGEIDIMESRGNRNLTINGGYIGVQQIGQTVHFPNRYSAHTKNNDNRGFDQGFHLYQLVWTPTKIRFLIDNEVIGTVDAGKPFDQEFYLIINLAIGGTNGYFPDNAVNPGGKPYRNFDARGMTDFWKNRLNTWLPTWKLNQNNGKSASLQVDYVRVWSL